MDTIIRLIAIVKNATSELENYIFKYRRLRYAVIKATTESVIEQVEKIEEEIKSPDLNDEAIANMQSALEIMFSFIEDTSNKYRNEDNSKVSYDENGKLLTEPVLYHVDLERKSWTNFKPLEQESVPTPKM